MINPDHELAKVLCLQLINQNRLKNTTIMTDLSDEEEDVWSLLRPIFEDEETTERTVRKNSQQESVGTNIRYKTEKCRYWIIYSNCPFGQSCSFAHGQIQIRQKLHIPVNYKTKLCTNFSRTGTCKYGDRCQFKHQTKEIPPKSAKKTKGFSELLDELPERLSQFLPVRRLKFFESFEADDAFLIINWKYKKPRMYTI